MTEATPRVNAMIKLRDDIVFEDPESRIREYCEIEEYRGYDDRHNTNAVISQEDIGARACVCTYRDESCFLFETAVFMIYESIFQITPHCPKVHLK